MIERLGYVNPNNPTEDKSLYEALPMANYINFQAKVGGGRHVVDSGTADVRCGNLGA